MNNSKVIGNKVYVSKDMRKKAIDIASEINDSAKTGSGTTEISKIVDPVLRELMESLKKRILIKATKKIDVAKLSKILIEEEKFEDELLKMPEIQATANLKEHLRFTYIRTILSRYGRPTKAQIWSILGKLGLSATDPGVNDTEELKELADSDSDFVKKLISMYLIEKEVKEGKLSGGRPSVLINSACKNINNVFIKKGINAVAIPKPLKKDYTSRGLTKPYKGKKAADVLIAYTDKTGKTVGISMEYFGWTGVSYERGVVGKMKEIADDFGHQYGVFAPNYADNEEALKRYTKDLFEREGDYFNEKASAIEKRAYLWVLSNDKYVGVSDADAIYNGFYGILNELGLARKVMPASKIKLFNR